MNTSSTILGFFSFFTRGLLRFFRSESVYMRVELSAITALIKGLAASDALSRLLCLILSSKGVYCYIGNKVINDYG